MCIVNECLSRYPMGSFLCLHKTLKELDRKKYLRRERPRQNKCLELTTKMSKSCFFLRFFVLLLGFSFICLGAFCISTDASACKCNSFPIAYLLLPMGFFLLISGIFWSIYHEASNHKSLFHSILPRNPRIRESHINTIDRPAFYPPSYEDSTDPEKQTFPLPVNLLEREKETHNIPPPLYTENSLEFIEEVSAQEDRPPSYEASVKQKTTERDSAREETSNASASETNC